MRWRLNGILKKVDRIVWAIFILFSLYGRVAAQESWEASDYGWFLAGGASAFILHESAHALVATSFGFDVRFESRRKPIPFVVVRYSLNAVKDESGQVHYTDEEGRPVSEGAQKRFAVASAGINSQNITSEIILSLYPNIREESRPYLKGVLAFDIFTSIGYAWLGRKDPDGDLRGMSQALGADDKLVATLVFLPAALDAYRYLYPESCWAPWAGRGAKAYLLGLSLRW